MEAWLEQRCKRQHLCRPASSAGPWAQQGWGALNKGRIHAQPCRTALVLALCSQRHPPRCPGCAQNTTPLCMNKPQASPEAGSAITDISSSPWLRGLMAQVHRGTHGFPGSLPGPAPSPPHTHTFCPAPTRSPARQDSALDTQPWSVCRSPLRELLQLQLPQRGSAGEKQHSTSTCLV